VAVLVATGLRASPPPIISISQPIQIAQWAISTVRLLRCWAAVRFIRSAKAGSSLRQLVSMPSRVRCSYSESDIDLPPSITATVDRVGGAPIVAVNCPIRYPRRTPRNNPQT